MGDNRDQYRERAGNQRLGRDLTRPAETHGAVVFESPNVAGMLKQKHIPDARRRGSDLSDASMAEVRRQLTNMCGWYGPRLVETYPVCASLRP